MKVNLTISDEEIDAFLTDHNNRAADSNALLVLDEPRRELLKGWRDVRACPGSGKTTILAIKLLLLASKWSAAHQGICVLTHTNVACDEIRTRLIGHSAGHRFQTYPHFVGTIQEFVHRFLALPYIRSKGIKVHRIDDVAAIAYMTRRANRVITTFLDRRKISIAGLKLDHETGTPKVPGFNLRSDKPSYKAMTDLLMARLRDGVFFYSEIYHYARKCAAENPEIVLALRRRFAAVFADEMQDTSDYQDDLIRSLFTCDEGKFQRIGDPDQAIFGSMGEGKANTSFNSDEDHHVIGTTHRFCDNICEKIAGLSVGRIDQIASLAGEERVSHPHTVLLFDDATKLEVLECFAAVVAEEDPDSSWVNVKAVGANDGEGGFIRQYWTAFDKRQTPSAFKPQSLRQAVTRDWNLFSSHTYERYSAILRAVVDLLRLAGVRRVEGGPFHSETSLRSQLKADGRYGRFRQLVRRWIVEPSEDEAQWTASVAELADILSLDATIDDLQSYLSFALPAEDGAPVLTKIGNQYLARNGRAINVGTIHSVKGETHDATLVLETQYHEWDVQHVLDYLARVDTGAIRGKRRIRAARLLYVGMSRPRHLVCLAMHQGHITAQQRTAMEALGWRFRMVQTPAANEEAI